MSGVIGTSGTAVVMPNTAGASAVTIASGVSISGTGTYGIGVYSQYIVSTKAVGPKSPVVGVAYDTNAVFSESIVNDGSIGGTAAGVRLVAPGTHVWSPAYGSPPAKYSTIFASATIVNNGTISGGAQGILIPDPHVPSTAPGASVLFNNSGALIEGGSDNTSVQGGENGVDITEGGVSARIVNAGTIVGLASYGAAVAFGGTITNTAIGLISAANGGGGIASSDSPLPSYVYNAGRIAGNVLLGTGGTIINKNHATISQGIIGDLVNGNQGALSLNNAGYIESTGNAVNADNLTLFNSASGTILATGNNGNDAVAGNVNNIITNDGYIGGPGFHGGVAINGAGTSTLLNASGATINGDANYAIDVSGTNNAAITNHGLVWGIVRFNGGTTASTLVNTGTILADAYRGGAFGYFNGRAIELLGPGITTITNVVGATISSGTVNGGAAYAIGDDGTHQAMVTNDGLIAGEVIFNAGSTSSTLVNAGTIGTSAAGYAVSFAAGSQDRLVVDPGVSFVGTIDGGNAVGATAVSNLEFGSGSGTFAGFGSTVLNFAQITIDSRSNWLLSGSVAGWNGETVTGLSDSNTIELVGTVEHKSSFAANTLTLDGGTTLNIAGSYTSSQISVTNDGTNTFINACFAEGTRIATARGEVAVENLLVGDRVLTASGRLAPVRWLGHRRTDIAHHPRPQSLMPVRIRAGAFGPDLPVRDLLVSPDHAVFADGHLFHARHLVNGVSIVTEQRQVITYWHVELDRHDIILAEGLPCESYLDTGNRAAFENAPGPTQLHPDFEPSAHELWEAEGCAPVHTDQGDAVLRGLLLRLMARAGRVTDVSLPCNADMAVSRTA